MQPSEGFEPILGDRARVLILGSLPGVKSIDEQQYYAHPRNAFWPIMRDLFSVDGDYATRCAGLRETGIALWDVLQASVRPGSLDADIDVNTAFANDFNALLLRYDAIESVFFNGKKAQELFRRLVLPTLCNRPYMCCLPSTSPAYAAMPYAEKREAWRMGLMPLIKN